MKVGIDIIEISRFEKMAQNKEHLNQIFTEKEIEYFEKFSFRLEHIAGTYAAKEAVCKAFKTGFSLGIKPINIEILHENSVPYVVLHDGAKDFFTENKFSNIDISISHDKTSATAICIIE